MQVIYLEDDQSQADLICQWLQEGQHEAIHCDSMDEFKQQFKNTAADLAVLDWELPKGSGIEVLRFLRRELESKIPVLFTTQRDTEDDIVKAFEEGADDYLVKPLRRREFDARLTALSRRAGIREPNSCIHLPPYTIDTASESIRLHDEVGKLTHKDYLLALCIFQNVGKALSREFLLREVWGVQAELDTRTVDVHISRVRRALKITPDNGFIIKNIFQYGYRLEKIA
ncbi:Phosphate regulon transcriptional regulatory protein PhoB [Thalassocella blandensis]|nr:Phosphate regulon transcriptional regulatory protein PhoB [Thalassocella blandensis]